MQLVQPRRKQQTAGAYLLCPLLNPISMRGTVQYDRISLFPTWVALPFWDGPVPFPRRIELHPSDRGILCVFAGRNSHPTRLFCNPPSDSGTTLKKVFFGQDDRPTAMCPWFQSRAIRFVPVLQRKKYQFSPICSSAILLSVCTKNLQVSSRIWIKVLERTLKLR